MGGFFLKILIMNQHMDDALGGSEIQCDIIATTLSKMGHEVIYGAINSKKDKYNKIYKVCPIKKLNIVAYHNLLKTLTPDIVYWRYDKKFLLYGSIISKINKVKIVFSISHIDNVTKWSHGSLKKTSNIFVLTKSICSILLQSIKSRINYFGFHFIDGVVSQKEDFLDLLPKRFNNSKIHIYNSMKIKNKESYDWNKQYVIWVANIKKAKNPEKYIELAKTLKHTDIDFLMIGKIQDPKFNYILDKDKLPSNLHYLGPKKIDEVNTIIANSLFLVHTCNPEGFCNNFIQAWLLGKPTISLYYDPDNIIQKNNIGFLSLTDEKMKEQVLELVNNNEHRATMGNKAKALSDELFNPNYNMKKLVLFLQKILS